MSERCHAPEASQVGKRLQLDDAESHHLIRVRRVRVGDALEVFDGRGSGFSAVVTNVVGKRAEVELTGRLAPRRAWLRITLGCAMPKGDRLEWLVEKAAELGVERLVPVVTERTVVNPRESRMDRLRRRAVEAAKQCGRFDLLEIDEPRPLSQWLGSEAGSPVRIVAHPGAGPIGGVGALEAGSSAAALIGPEGGLTEAEVREAEAQGWRAVGLGPILLRIETAAVAVAASLLARVERGG